METLPPLSIRTTLHFSLPASQWFNRNSLLFSSAQNRSW
jgi:hypothetical protein